MTEEAAPLLPARLSPTTVRKGKGIYFRTSLVGMAMIAIFVLARVYEAGYDDAAARAGIRPFVIHTAASAVDAELGNSWESLGPAEKTSLIRFIVAVKVQNVDLLEAHALEVSNPASDKYGKHWKLDAISELIKPLPASVAAVEAWLTAGGVDTTTGTSSAGGSFFSATVTVETAEKLVCAHSPATCHYVVWRPIGHTHTVLRLANGEYSIPASVADHVDLVGPTGDLPPIRSLAAVRSVPATAAASAGCTTAGCNDAASSAASSSAALSSSACTGSSVTVDCLKEMYEIPSDALTGSGSSDTKRYQAVASFLEECFDADDLHTFLAAHGRPSAKIARSHIVGKVGCDRTIADLDDVETMLDVEMIMTLSDSTTYLFYESGRMPGAVYNEPFLSWLEKVNSVGGSPPGPTVFSISYADWEDSVSVMYKTRAEVELAKLALRGMTVVVATGDAGVEGAQTLPTYAWPGHTCGAGDKFIADWPATSKWVTAVGGHGVSSTESAALSGGGFRCVERKREREKFTTTAAAIDRCPPSPFSRSPTLTCSRARCSPPFQFPFLVLFFHHTQRHLPDPGVAGSSSGRVPRKSRRERASADVALQRGGARRPRRRVRGDFRRYHSGRPFEFGERHLRRDADLRRDPRRPQRAARRRELAAARLRQPAALRQRRCVCGYHEGTVEQRLRLSRLCTRCGMGPHHWARGAEVSRSSRGGALPDRN